ncbi:hypothetical protein MMC20_006610 [Loxospora ochrophaea]|nr:hypothetical protein [Loxospora ochrophaea]
MFSIVSVILALFSFSVSVVSVPTLNYPRYQTYTTSPQFTIVAHVISSNRSLSIEDWAIYSYHTGAGLATATLLNPATYPDPPRYFYVNGTAADVRYNTADVLSDGGTPPFPEGLIVPPPTETDDEGRRYLQINAGDGTPGVGITRFPDSQPRVYYADHETPGGPGQFYACNSTLIPPFSPEIVVYYRGQDALTPPGCVDITLYPQCAGALTPGANHTFAQPAECYANVTTIPGGLC